MKMSRFSQVVSAAAAVLTGVLCVQTLAGSVRAGDGAHMPVPEEYAGRITVYENGDFAYGYTADDVALDSEAMTLYVPGLINIFPEEELSRPGMQALARLAGGTEVRGSCGGVYTVQE